MKIKKHPMNSQQYKKKKAQRNKIDYKMTEESARIDGYI
jgi:hypothetical protein